MDEVTFLGDVYLPEEYTSDLDISPFVCNLEYPITSATEGWPGKINLRAGANHLEKTFGDAPLAVSLANNHIMDYGQAGFEDTVTELEGADIGYFGAGPLSENCHNPLVVNCGDESLGLCGYVCESTSPVFATRDRPGVRSIDLDVIEDDIKRARAEGANHVVVFLHWGAEEVPLPKPDDVATGRCVIDAGADLVVGQHAHRIQPVEQYGNGAIFYGLGNCIMPDLNTPAYYTDGAPSDRFEKQQRTWNRRSLAVSFDGTVARVSGVKFENETLSSHSTGLLRLWSCPIHLHKYSEILYRKLFKALYFCVNLKLLLSKFLADPTVPTLKHVQIVLDLIRDSEYD